MTFPSRLAAPRTTSRRSTAPTASTRPDGLRPRRHRHREAGRVRTVPLVAAAAAVAVLASGTAVVASAHKTVTLDVAGEVTEVSTFAGSVDGLLEDRGIEVGAHDDVAPGGALRDGSEVVVRFGRQITVASDGEERVVWTTALTADEALETLTVRDEGVSLVASRSASGGRPQLPMDLRGQGPVQVLVDGETLTAPDADTTVDEILDELEVELNELDTVAVSHSAADQVQVVVTRITLENETRTKKVAFETVTKQDASKYTDQRTVVTKGVNGERTIVERVRTVNGKETGRKKLSDEVTTKPVDEVISVGTKKRPVVAAKPGPITAGGDADSLNWAALAACESGGRVDAVSASGTYHGLYQFSVATWRGVGGAGPPSDASAAEQTSRAKMLYNRSGAGQWPHCGPRLFG